MDLSQIIGGVAIGVILAVLAFGIGVKSALVRIETILTGARGDNGLVGDVRNLHERQHAFADRLASHDGRLDLHDQRLQEYERRQGPDDRRAAS